MRTPIIPRILAFAAGLLVMACAAPVPSQASTAQPSLPALPSLPSPTVPPSPSATSALSAAPTSTVVLCGHLDSAACLSVVGLVRAHLSFAPQATAIVMDYFCPPDGGCPAGAGFSAVVSIVVPADPTTDYAFWPPTYLAVGQTGPDELNPFPDPELPVTIQQLLREAGFDYQAPATAPPSPEANGVPSGISEQQAITLAADHTNGPAHLVSANAGPLANVIPDGSSLAPELDPAWLVWLVRFDFADPNFCIYTPMGQQLCRAMSGTTFVLLDFRTGEFLESGTSASPY